MSLVKKKFKIFKKVSDALTIKSKLIILTLSLTLLTVITALVGQYFLKSSLMFSIENFQASKLIEYIAKIEQQKGAFLFSASSSLHNYTLGQKNNSDDFSIEFDDLIFNANSFIAEAQSLGVKTDLNAFKESLKSLNQDANSWRADFENGIMPKETLIQNFALVIKKLNLTLLPIKLTKEETSPTFNKNYAATLEMERKNKFIFVGLVLVLLFFVTFAFFAVRSTTRSLFEFKRHLGQISNDTISGNLNSRCNIDEVYHEFRPLAQGFNDTLDAIVRPIQESLTILKVLEKGDLTKLVSGDYQGDHAILKNGLNTTISSLNDILKKVTSSMNTVNNNSAQLSSASQGLAQGTSEQASALSELSSTLVEIEGQSKENGTKAVEFKTLTLQSQSAAKKGLTQMTELHTAMREISNSSLKIKKVISIIDEIAFQTNLLALNAAVEAARAGRHGKGFAVVAEEVRNLAAKSAEAAKETSAMIEDSVKKITLGGKFADETQKSLHQIITEINQMTAAIDGIAQRSESQTASIAQSVQAIKQIEVVTQNNAASAEQSAAVSKNLLSEAVGLKKEMNRFSIN